MVTVEFEPVGRRVEVEPGRTVLQAARDVLSLDAGGVNAPCGGKGLCGRCRVRLVQGELSPPGELERRMLGPRELADGYRLACQALILGPVKVEIPPETLAGRQSLQVAGTAEEIALEPVIKRYHIPLQATTVDFPFSTWQQVEVYLRQNYGMEDISIDSVLFSQVETLAGNDRLTVSLRGREIINAFWTAGSRKPLGLAVDLGTTKMAGFLLDLETGSTLAADGILNPQIAYGEDVMSRLAYALEGAEQYSRITRVLVEGLERLLQTLCSQAGARPEDVEEAVIVGNTAMHHLLLGLPVGQLARSPYVPALTLPL
ncbi:MAG: 2Fe-2S iron-sulfur cluster-binding protein, partial [Bacillota bacterium]